MPGWGNVAGFVVDLFGSKAERRRNAISKLEARHEFIEQNKRNDLVAEYESNKRKLKQLLTEAANA